MSAPQPPTAEKRHNHSLRRQAQAWFDALRLHITDVAGAETIASLIQGWQKPEDVMRDYPALVPLFLDMIWRSRKAPGFADLFRTESGEIAESPTEVLALSQKTFDDIILAHLMGTMRLTCERRQNEWLSAERERRRGALSKMPVVGAALRGLGLLSPAKTQVLLADYPHKGLYEALKPILCRREQFALVESLATLPTRTASLVGPALGAISSPAVISILASLDRAKVKIALEMAETFVESASDTRTEGEAAGAGPLAPLGLALADMLSTGTDFLKTATSNKQLAKDAIAKLAPVMRGDMWPVLGNPESLRRIAECPAGIAANLQALTVEVNERVSIALSEIVNDRVAALAMETLRGEVDAETFLSWIRDEAHLVAWKQLVVNLNRDTNARTASSELGTNQKAAIKTICGRAAPAFANSTRAEKEAA